MGQPVGSCEDAPLALLIQREAIVGSGPDAIAVDGNAVDTVVRQAVRGAEVFPAVARHLLSRNEGNKPTSDDCDSHIVFRNSMRSLSSSFARSLVTPWVSLGLKTVQISSSV